MAGTRDNLSHNRILIAVAAAAAATGNIVGVILDTQEFDSHLFGLLSSLSDEAGAVVLTIEEDDDIGFGTSNIAASQDVLVGDLTTNTQGSVNSVTVPAGAEATAKIGYVGNKRFIRLIVTKNGTSSAIAAALVSAHAYITPVP